MRLVYAMKNFFEIGYYYYFSFFFLLGSSGFMGVFFQYTLSNTYEPMQKHVLSN